MKLLNLSRFSAIGFVLILLMFHLINTDIDPSWQPISEYALGRMGWLMNIAFFLFGLSFLSLGLFFLKKEKAVVFKIAGVFLFLAAIGNILAALFDTDPVDTLPHEMTTSGSIHAGAAGLLGFMILAAILVCFQVYRQEILKPIRFKILSITLTVVLLEIVMVTALGIYLGETNGMLTSETPIGGIGRLVILSCAVWVIVTSSSLQNLKGIHPILGPE
ncbi:DUF998 domain-containing protein [Algoriphagus sp. D3-2-R+10]|uniref:DUF998 domain-containing protein n=1 Tax=Algoriphagus aurantiacus TaxID=3103948 RepID=UPI002B367985|nr:DUF998 domain-containing protein [Algoriphagus sp. D3-2-R+10]MEB2778142.1 DUF998 domain-containing protein [Algoriphagus sp. D3-2-R+10]